MTHSRLRIDSASGLPSIHSFTEIGDFLRASTADEDAVRVSQTMAEVAAQVEVVIASMAQAREGAALAPLLVDLLTVLRTHRSMVIGLGPDWRSLYEYAPYLAALNNFRLLVGGWLRQASEKDLNMLPVGVEDFKLIAWRALGEGLLLIDMYEQWVASPPHEKQTVPGLLDQPHVERAIQWWKKLRL